MTLGRIFNEIQADHLGSAMFPRMIHNGQLDEFKDLMPPSECLSEASIVSTNRTRGYSIHVDDVALLHVAGFVLPETAGRRLYACAHPSSWNRRLFPRKQFPDDIKDIGTTAHEVPQDEAEQVLRKMNMVIYGHSKGWKEYEQSIKDCFIGMPGLEES